MQFEVNGITKISKENIFESYQLAREPKSNKTLEILPVELLILKSLQK